MVSLNNFDSLCKELLWHKEKYEQNFHKALAAVQSQEDVETLRSNIQRLRSILDNCELSVNGLDHQWDLHTRRKSSIRSISELNGNGPFLASNSSSERSSNGSPFQNGFNNDITGSFSALSLGSEEYYDGYSSDILNILGESSQEDQNRFMEPGFVNFSNPVGFELPSLMNNGNPWSSSPWNSPAVASGELFQGFTPTPSAKPSFAAVAQLPPVVESFASVTRKSSSDASSPTSAQKSGPMICETPITSNLQKPHLAKIIYVFPLNYKMDETVLEKYFTKFGKVAKTKIFRYPNGASKTAGIIEFEDASSALAAIKKTHMVDGCQIEAKQFEPKTHGLGERQSTHGIVTRSNHFVNNTEYQVFIGGIPTNATDEDIEKAITVFGKIKRIQVNPNGTFAFVSFATDADAGKLVGVHSINIAGKLVECKRNQPQQIRPKTSNDDKPTSSTAACQFCKKARVKAILTCDHRVECFECVKQQRVCPKCGSKLDLSKEPAKTFSTSYS